MASTPRFAGFAVRAEFKSGQRWLGSSTAAYRHVRRPRPWAQQVLYGMARSSYIHDEDPDAVSVMVVMVRGRGHYARDCKKLLNRCYRRTFKHQLQAGWIEGVGDFAYSKMLDKLHSDCGW